MHVGRIVFGNGVDVGTRRHELRGNAFLFANHLERQLQNLGGSLGGFAHVVATVVVLGQGLLVNRKTSGHGLEDCLTDARTCHALGQGAQLVQRFPRLGHLGSDLGQRVVLQHA